jgi:hypothetical protein
VLPARYNNTRGEDVYRSYGVPSCTRLCNALSAALSAGSSGRELMKCGSDSSEASCSLNEGACGP